MPPGINVNFINFQGLTNLEVPLKGEVITTQGEVQNFLSFLEILLMNLFGGQNFQINPGKNNEITPTLVGEQSKKDLQVKNGLNFLKEKENTNFYGTWIQLFQNFLKTHFKTLESKNLVNFDGDFEKDLKVLIKRFFTWLRKNFIQEAEPIRNQLESLEKAINEKIEEKFKNPQMVKEFSKEIENEDEEKAVLKVIKDVFKEVIHEKKEVITKATKFLTNEKESRQVYEELKVQNLEDDFKKNSASSAELKNEVKEAKDKREVLKNWDVSLKEDKSQKFEGILREVKKEVKSYQKIDQREVAKVKLEHSTRKDNYSNRFEFKTVNDNFDEKRVFNESHQRLFKKEFNGSQEKALKLLSQTYQSLDLNTFVRVINKKVKPFNENGLTSEFLQFVKRFTTEVYPRGERVAIIDLEPPSLGKMHLEVKVKHKEVELVIKVEKPEVLHELQAHIHHIKQGLEEAGFQLKDTTFSLTSSFEGGLLREGFSERREENRGSEAKKETTRIERVSSEEVVEVREKIFKNEKGKYYYIA